MADYNQMKLKDLKQIGKDMGLPRVDKYNKHNKSGKLSQDTPVLPHVVKLGHAPNKIQV